MGPIRGRSDDMLIVRGVNLYPTQIEEILTGIPEVVPHYQVLVTRERTMDEVEVKVEITEDVFHHIGQEVLSSDVIEADQTTRNLRDKICFLIKDTLGLTVNVTLMAPGSVPRSEGGKLRRTEDRRNLSSVH